jgi:hypothetical protein
VDAVLRDAEKILSPLSDAVGAKNAARIWGFMSKFVMLDRFSKTLGVADIYPGSLVSKNVCSVEYLGTGSKVNSFSQSTSLCLDGLQILDEINPPTKVLGKFLRAWGDREQTRAKYLKAATNFSSVNLQDPAGVALTLSRRLIAVVKVKSVLHIEAGLEMIALAMAISSEVSNVDVQY